MAPPAPSSLILRLCNDPQELPRLAVAVEAFLAGHGQPASLAARVNLALDELLTNVMQYGLADAMPDPPADRAEIEVSLDLAGDRLVAEIRDRGVPFNPLQRADPDVDATLEDREIGGLGIFLARQMMDVIRYRRADGHNCLTLVKRLPGAGAS